MMKRDRHSFAALLLVVTTGISGPVFAADGTVSTRASDVQLQLRGHVGQQVRQVTENWLLRAPGDNPAMLAMFADRDGKPYRDLLPWSGEFAGKYLTGATQVLRLTNDPALRKHLDQFVPRLIALQADDGYLGPFPKDSRLTGKAPNVGGNATWDAWGHYHVMLGLLTWHELTGDEAALRCATRIGDLLCEKFLGSKGRVVDTGSAEMNQAVVHSLALLHERTKEKKYLDLALEVVDEFADPNAGDYLNNGLAGKAFYQCRKPRWESLHPILGLAELHRITGNGDYRKAFEQLWWSIAEHDRHNNGGFSSGEQAQGNPYHGGAIETCCTIAWMAMSIEMLKLTGDPVVADELELSTLNQVVGLHSPDGKWCTYNTPMDGKRVPSTEDIAFQKRPGSEQLNCCSVNAARGFGMISEWALMSDADGLVLNWYGPSIMTAKMGEVPVRIEQNTDYPRGGRVMLRVEPQRATEFTLKLRIPHWSRDTQVAVNDQPVPDVKPGRHLDLRRTWHKGDAVAIDLDMSIRAWAGERECAGKVALYRGPILLAYEATRDARPPELNLSSVMTKAAPADAESMVKVDVRDDKGTVVRLRDYGTAGKDRKPYVTWLPAKGTKLTPFSRSNPLRSTHAGS
jgi:uncharacterized protein